MLQLGLAMLKNHTGGTGFEGPKGIAESPTSLEVNDPRLNGIRIKAEA